MLGSMKGQRRRHDARFRFARPHLDQRLFRQQKSHGERLQQSALEFVAIVEDAELLRLDRNITGFVNIDFHVKVGRCAC